MIRILLIEDHVILRQGLRSLLDMEDDLSVIGEAGTGDDGIRIAAAEKPDLIITDIGLPGRSGISIIAELRTSLPRTRILVLTAHCTDAYIRAVGQHQHVGQGNAAAYFGRQLLDSDFIARGNFVLFAARFHYRVHVRLR